MLAREAKHTFQPRNGSIGIPGGVEWIAGGLKFQPRNGSIGMSGSGIDRALYFAVSTPQRFDWNEPERACQTRAPCFNPATVRLEC